MTSGPVAVSAEALVLDEAPPRYRAERITSLAEFLTRCERLLDGRSLPFHHRCWLQAWYGTLGTDSGRQPVWLGVRHPDGRDALLLPLTRRLYRGLWWAEYADAGVVDYVAPLVATDWAAGSPPLRAAAALRQAMREALDDCDVLRIEKLLPHGLAETGRAANPLVLAWPTASSTLSGNQFEVSGEWEDWRRSLDKRVRKEIERCWRVFQRSPQARFERITDPARATEILATLEQQQSGRLRPLLGHRYRLDEPAYRDFYRQLLTAGLADGQVVLTALLDGEHVVSALLGMANEARYIGLRQSLGADAWKHCSPGRLLDEQTARHMHENGRRHFDFGVGDYFHKTTLQMEQIPLLEVCVALSWRGKLATFTWRMKRWLKQQPHLMAAWRRIQAFTP